MVGKITIPPQSTYQKLLKNRLQPVNIIPNGQMLKVFPHQSEAGLGLPCHQSYSIQHWKF